ncbi:MAG: family 16 glycosylhydrolase [Bacteroidales bacterium]|nr:family 16 glycosylhydrolase [Bacteroidales bacterium]
MRNLNSIYHIYLIVILTLITSCTKAEEEIPVLSIPDALSVTEGTESTNYAVIPVTLSTSSKKEVTLKWSTSDGTATAPEDYIAQEEMTLVFAPGETSKEIRIEIVRDTIYETDEYFFVVAGSLKNATLGQSQCKVTILNDDYFVPKIQIPERLFFQEGNATQIEAKIPVRLSGPALTIVSLKWSTVSGTAKPGEDYIAVENETMVFSPGETEKFATIKLVNDLIFEMDDQFSIHFSEIQNATAEKNSTIVVILNDDAYSVEMTDDGAITPDTYPLFQLVWSDDFDGTAINLNNWGYNIGAGGWGNQELQSYTSSPQNSYVEDGKLNIVATKLYNSYNSARLLTQGKKEFTYGRIDIRAKMPYGQGIWPALWTLGANISQVSWPRCGEIDIMEYLGHRQHETHGTVHYFDGGHRYKGGTYALPMSQSFHDKFHVFSVVWQESGIRWYVNYELFYEIKDTDIKYEAFRLPHFFIFNVAVGGIWPGYPNETTVFPQRMIVDYIRVFQVPD